MLQVTPRWRRGRFHGLKARLAYPLFLLLNRPRFAGFGRLAYDFALRCNGLAINFPGPGGLSRAEDAFLRRLAPQLRDGVIFDVGANEGAYARRLAALLPQARILAFEPHPRTAARLRGRVPANVEVVEQAVGAAAGSVVLHDFAGEDGSTQASLDPGAIRLYGGEPTRFEVACTTIDDILAARGIERVAFLKVDTEGYDLAVLKGAARALAERRIGVIQFEFIGANIVTGATMRQFFEVLEGYDIGRLCLNGEVLPLPAYSVRRCEIFVSQNLVARARPR
ncbi:FkbM family methyltransferase [Siccirubricoccus phaeus]|uniref:FkbM family methyltransferase n=1 Tax=Siccirubricoccus phaeus TaxID=2595053 RepID=UPI0011F3C4B8|nr:FkbM family methyltransferase [Siccirubricoccus phaeus]